MRGLYVLFALALPSSASAAAPDNARRYATCLAENRPSQVAQLLSASSADAASVPYHALSDDDRCFSRVYGSGYFRPEEVPSQDMLRGELAEQSLLARANEVAALQPLPLQQKRYIRTWFAATGRNPAVDEMAACMADTDPAGIATLIRTEAGSSEESAAIGSLAPNLTRCLGAGTRLDASGQALRAALADALYQRLSKPQLSLVEVKK